LITETVGVPQGLMLGMIEKQRMFGWKERMRG